MPDLTLRDGREIEIDLYQITIKEWRSLLDPNQPDEDEYKLLANVTGLKPDDIENMPQPDFRRLVEALREKSLNPVSDPN